MFTVPCSTAELPRNELLLRKKARRDDIGNKGVRQAIWKREIRAIFEDLLGRIIQRFA